MDQKPRTDIQIEKSILGGLSGHVVKMLELTYFNPLTGLPGRQAFVGNLQCALDAKNGGRACRVTGCVRKNNGGCLNRTGPVPAEIGFIKLDNLHFINSGYGNNAGEHVIKTLTRYLKNWVGPNNMLGSIGQDRFFFALFGDPYESRDKIKSLIRQLNRPMTVSGARINLIASVGATSYPDRGKRASTLMDQAENAVDQGHRYFSDMYNYQPGSKVDTVLAADLMTHLGKIVDKGLIHPHYQPQINLSEGKLAGFEALVRWEHPRYGMILARRFIRLAEEAGIIQRLDLGVFREVCADLSDWSDGGLPIVPVSVNFSKVTLLHPDTLPQVKAILSGCPIPGRLLKIEINEGDLIKNAGKIGAAVDDLRKTGLKISIDDFGNGESNLKVLGMLEFDQIKIARDHVHGVSAGSRPERVFKFINNVARGFGTDLVYGGVESENDVEYLGRYGCGVIQGRYFSNPVDRVRASEIMTRMDEITQTVAGAPLSYSQIADRLRKP